jgi:hypothetical protein
LQQHFPQARASERFDGRRGARELVPTEDTYGNGGQRAEDYCASRGDQEARNERGQAFLGETLALFGVEDSFGVHCNLSSVKVRGYYRL